MRKRRRPTFRDQQPSPRRALLVAAVLALFLTGIVVIIRNAGRVTRKLHELPKQDVQKQ